jgi:2-polyprenyl-3-methyl-5-hydroxy-6-metoxy-1,4-benzoquinol methylase
MPKTGLKLVEVGSAPGDHLVRLWQTFGVDPYGIEYSDIGVVRNRQLFSSHNIDPNHVIHADFFAEEFHKQYRESFDIVVSIGFIEHFADAESVIEKHLNLLRTGGTFMISVPNFRGFNYFLLWFFQKELIPLHNFEVMHKKEFIKCFTKQGIRLLFCDYYGTFDFELFSARTPWKKLVWNFCIQVQHILNLLFRLIFRHNGRENMFCSPMLIAIGVKDKSADH